MPDAAAGGTQALHLLPAGLAALSFVAKAFQVTMAPTVRHARGGCEAHARLRVSMRVTYVTLHRTLHSWLVSGECLTVTDDGTLIQEL